MAGCRLTLSSDLERDLARAALFVYITHSEGLGSAALLAMSAGVPVIASAVGGLREIVRDRENGLLVENTAEAIAAAIGELLAAPDFARRLGRAGRATVAQRFTVERMAQGTLGAYRRALGRAADGA